MNASDIILRRQNRTRYIGSLIKQQAFNKGIITNTKGANQSHASSELLSVLHGKINFDIHEC
jgi:hypothetical protein